MLHGTINSVFIIIDGQASFLIGVVYLKEFNNTFAIFKTVQMEEKESEDSSLNDLVTEYK